ncbi:hypothetical protein RIF29_19588 [Crotalaria pallida]|uniref:Uncharacterized protein n=1 Tax=Crotalaria pallida TaxID=3830 RepID=A0AAN9EZQ0_CROPI
MRVNTTLILGWFCLYRYVMGFVMTLVAAALYGFVLPLVELAYKKTEQAMTYSLVLEIQFVIGTFASLFNIVGMIINNDFKTSAASVAQLKSLFLSNLERKKCSLIHRCFALGWLKGFFWILCLLVNNLLDSKAIKIGLNLLPVFVCGNLSLDTNNLIKDDEVVVHGMEHQDSVFFSVHFADCSSVH